MAKLLSDAELATIREQQVQAINHLHSLVGGERFRTSIPVQDGDSDVVIGNSLYSVVFLLDHIAAVNDGVETTQQKWEVRCEQYKAEFGKLFDAAQQGLTSLEEGDLKAVEETLRYIKLKAMALG